MLARIAAAVLAIAVAASSIARAQSQAAEDSKPADAAAVVPLWPGVPPGSEAWNWHEQVSLPPWSGEGGRLVRNVVRPSLTVFLPAKDTASGTGIVVAPGGGFRWLSIDSEGYDVARWLTAHGVAAFVLKYRLEHTPESDEALKVYAASFVEQLMKHPVSDASALGPDQDLAAADALQAMKLVRSHAPQWGVDPRRIGMMGFSAGGLLTNVVATKHDVDSRPDFVAPIYGIPSGAAVPADAAPIFLAASADDPLVVPATDIALYTAWRAAGHPAELHLFSGGGHGFGMVRQGKTSDHWIDEFGWWLDAQGLLRRGQ